MKKIPEVIKITARKLRKNQNFAESLLWEEIKDRKLKVKFQRQFPIYIFTENSGLDRYIICDFYCSEHKLIIELDGSIHNNEEVYKLDIYKEEILREKGYNIIRFKNIDISDNISFSLNKIAASFSGKEREFKSELEKKKFTMRNESFLCENCHKEISKHPSGSARNHCPFCLHSKHLDKDFPGDRASECLSIMKPIGKDYRKNKGWMVIHECQKCLKNIPNKLAEDDSVEVFGKL